MNTQSSLFRALTEQELARILSAALHTSAAEAQLVAGGMFNTTYAIRTEAGDDVILRAGPVNRHLLLPFEHDMMQTEALMYQICAEHGIPASEVLAVDTTKTIVDRDFMIVRRIPSRTIDQFDFTPEEHARIFGEFGRCVARLHAITRPRFGRVRQVLEGGGYATWAECLQQEIAQWESVAAPAGLFTRAEHQHIRSLYRDHTPLLNEVQTATLVHTDLGWGNILVRTDTPRPEFGAIIDPDRALWGDVEFEFCHMDWLVEKDFMAGYGRWPSQEPKAVARRRMCRIMRKLWDVYVYAVEYNMPDHADATRSEIRKLIDEM